MRIVRSLPVLSLMLAASQALAAPLALRIDVKPVLENSRSALQVDVRYRAAAGGTCFIELPNEWADQQEFYKAVHGLRLVGSSAPLRETDKPHMRSFDCRRNQAIHLQYELRQESPEALNNARRYRFAMTPEYFHLIGYAGWVLPKAEENDRLKVDLRWNEVLKGWVLASSHGNNALRLTIAASVDQFRASLFVGGDFRLRSMKDDGGRNVTVAMRGEWPYSDEDFSEKVRRIIGAERAFWRSQEARYLVTLIPVSEPPGATSIGGTSLTSAFATFITPNAKLEDLSMLLAHEYFHNWNSQQLGYMAEPQQAVYWISEGFTDYYAALLLLRNGQLTLDGYLEHCNRLLKNVYLSPVREADNKRVIEAFWSDPNVQKLPYNRGALLAMDWQAQIDAASGGKHSFDDVMHGLQQQAAGAQKKMEKLPDLNAERLVGLLERYGARDTSSLVQRHIEEGQLIVPRADWFGPAVELRQVELPVFELGLDLPKLREKLIAGVNEGSAAYAAGLRNGQRVVKRTPFYWDNTDQTIEVTVEHGDAQQTFRFQPRAPKGRIIAQYFLRPDASAAQLAQTRHLLGIPTR
jgi:predicted metalloprotease with PDZ domain